MDCFTHPDALLGAVPLLGWLSAAHALRLLKASAAVLAPMMMFLSNRLLVIAALECIGDKFDALMAKNPTQEP